MQDDWPSWARDAWRCLSPRQADNARTVWTTLVREFDGVLVGPAALIRHLVDQGRLGHRSTMETIALLVDEDLLEARQAAEGTVLWVPEQLMPETDPLDPRPSPRFLSSPRTNGSQAIVQA